ncbi:MAG: amidohydrolase family protein [Proteobacteria bacterium]|nr:amidohydrolase family protein [Pseudomonadota bacterium]MCP4918551.1 amidohydrolase family protein [Pseudomonadota bacterium]
MWLWLACTSPDVSEPSDSVAVAESPVDSPQDSDTGGGPDWPDAAWVLDGVTVADARGRQEDRAVIVVGDLIWDVVDAGQDWPQDWRVVDGTGRYVLPGLIDSHVHLAYSGSYGFVGDTVEQNLAAQLAWGVTAVVDAGGPEWTWSMRDRIAAGELAGPRMKAAGPFLTAVGSHPCETGNDRGLCRYVDGDGGELASGLRSGGADVVKVALSETGIGVTWPRLDLGDLADIASTGETLVHVGSAEDLRDAIDQGAEHIAHVPFADDITGSDAVGATSLSSTVGASGLARIRDQDLDSDVFSTVPEAVLDNWRTAQGATYASWASYDQDFADQTRSNLQVLVAAEAPLLAGSDAGYWFVPHGLALHWELEELVDAGMEPVDAIAAATSVPASIWGWDDVGFVYPGYRADLVLVGSDPLADIGNTQDIVRIWQGGEPVGDVWLAEGGPFCLDDRDCAEGCDPFEHVCADACDPPYVTSGACDEDSWCMPEDGLSSSDGVCHPEEGCDWLAQDCDPAYYGENCVPADVDTSYCWPSGPREAFETCNYLDAGLRCEQGLFCSTLNWRCYELCDPDGPNTCSAGTCHQERAEGGEEWFGLCY